MTRRVTKQGREQRVAPRRADKRSNMHYTKAAYVSEDPDNDKPEALMKLLERVGAVGPKTEQRVMALTGPQVDKARAPRRLWEA